MATSKKRDEEPKQVIPVGDNFGYLLPHQDNVDDLMAPLQKHRVLNRLKTLQGLSNPELKALGGEGGVIIMPARVLLTRAGEAFNFVPLFFFEEFIAWSDIRDTSNPKIAARSMDENSAVARRARDSKLWTETYEGGTKDKPFIRRYCEHLNFAGVLYMPDHELHKTPVVLSFARGEFKVGRQFISSIGMRRINGRQAPYWATVWSCKSSTHKNQSGQSWYGIDVSNADKPYIESEDVDSFKSEHEMLKKAHMDQLLVVNREDENAEEASGETDASAAADKKF